MNIEGTGKIENHERNGGKKIHISELESMYPPSST